jgi:hypothetical protein
LLLPPAVFFLTAKRAFLLLRAARHRLKQIARRTTLLAILLYSFA